MTICISQMLLSLTALLVIANTSLAQSEAPLSASSEKKSVKRDAAPLRTASQVDLENKALAQVLVHTHLPELKPVLEQLQTDQPKQYERAVRELARSARKLDLAKKRDGRLFDVEVELLKAETQASLLTARLAVRDRVNDRKSLQTAVARLLAAKTSKASYDVEMIRKRLERDQKLLNTAEQRLSRYQQDVNVMEETYLGFLRKAGREPETAKSQLRKKKQTDATAPPE